MEDGLSDFAVTLIVAAIAAAFDCLRRFLRKYRNRGTVNRILYEAIERHAKSGTGNATGAQAVKETAKLTLATMDTPHHLRELALSYAAKAEENDEGKAAALLRRRKQKRKIPGAVKRALGLLPILGAIGDVARACRGKR